MTHQAPALQADFSHDAAGQLSQLRQVLALVEQIAGRDGAPAEAALDEAARIDTAYADALPVVRRRFDALVAETIGWAAAGVEALARAGGPRPAAARLANELADAIEDLLRLLTR
jgi:hypothetical protein